MQQFQACAGICKMGPEQGSGGAAQCKASMGPLQAAPASMGKAIAGKRLRMSPGLRSEANKAPDMGTSGGDGDNAGSKARCIAEHLWLRHLSCLQAWQRHVLHRNRGGGQHFGP